MKKQKHASLSKSQKDENGLTFACVLNRKKAWPDNRIYVFVKFELVISQKCTLIFFYIQYIYTIDLPYMDKGPKSILGNLTQ